MTTYQEHLKVYYNKLEECYEHIKKQDTNIRYFHTIFKDESDRLNALEILDKNFRKEHEVLLTELMRLFKIKIELENKETTNTKEEITKEDKQS